MGLVAFWVPVIGRKGGPAHKRWGRVFNWSMLVTGGFAVLISTCTLIAPLETHPLFDDAALVRGIFGWMMLYLATLTINLAWYGWRCIDNKLDHLANRDWRNLALQAIVFVTAANCAWHGFVLRQPLMMGISIIGFATVATNLWFIYTPRPRPLEWLKEHVKGLVGAGISVYTAFFAFGAVRVMPELALHPGLWAVPLTVGLAIIIYHRFQIAKKLRRPAQRRVGQRSPQAAE